MICAGTTRNASAAHAMNPTPSTSAVHPRLARPMRVATSDGLADPHGAADATPSGTMNVTLATLSAIWWDVSAIGIDPAGERRAAANTPTSAVTCVAAGNPSRTSTPIRRASICRNGVASSPTRAPRSCQAIASAQHHHHVHARRSPSPTPRRPSRAPGSPGVRR